VVINRMGVYLCLGLCFCSLLDGWRGTKLRNKREHDHFKGTCKGTPCRI